MKPKKKILALLLAAVILTGGISARHLGQPAGNTQLLD